MAVQPSADSGLRDRIDRDYIDAMRKRDAARLSTLRMLKNAVQNAEKSKSSPLTDDEVVEVLGREVKVHRESLTEFEKGNRLDLVAGEAAALEILAPYLPEQLTDDDLHSIVQAAVRSLPPQAADNQRAAKGQVMKMVMPQIKGRADGGRVTAIVDTLLAARE